MKVGDLVRFKAPFSAMGADAAVGIIVEITPAVFGGGPFNIRVLWNFLPDCYVDHHSDEIEVINEDEL